ncbi:hypothetical protein [Agromyces marinus]|uniref:Fe-S oxidoreductase n=1 Tax=Agromyces marinus TaxID=1389020 RepID=A0ABN6Y7M5_9MICO|nr:hypothetical protein [Agromyces marinus]UIP58688.1 hypothetical protein DSM26151_15680 [Agromyces marinus]BDZ53016.1 hypothetical protein GCM10025870_00890 [Agromyces marinus]
MQLGTRWPFGTQPPRSVPMQIRPGIAAAEADTVDGAGRTWTLTWLEGRPIAELDDGTTVTVEPSPGADADDDW